MVAQKRAPRLTRRSPERLLTVAAHGASADVEAKRTQLTNDADGAPPWMLSGDAQDQPLPLGGNVGTPRSATTAARLRPTDPTTAVGATKLALRELARRVQRLEAECRRLDAVLEQLVATTAPALVACFGVGTDTAGALLVSAGDNPQRLRSEAAFAHHCGVAPIDASSGLTIRKRLNRGGDRTANQALWRIVMVRMVHDPRTRRYVERRTREGRSKREIIRSLKRYVARQLYRHLPRAESLA